MAHNSTLPIANWLSGHNNVLTATLDNSAVADIRIGLRCDAAGLTYSSALSFAEAISALPRAQFSWSTVKLYYSAFYAIRAMLAWNDIAIHYIGTKPYSLNLLSGGALKKEQGVTHKVVWSVFRRELAHSSILGIIDSQNANEWLTALREQANYKNAQFPDPAIPTHFAAADSIGLNAALAAYISDNTMLYAFDPDHAAVAYPLECLRNAISAARRVGISTDVISQEHLVSCLSGFTSVQTFLNF